MDFRPAYWQISGYEQTFVNGYVADLEKIAENTGQQLIIVLQQPFPYELNDRAITLLNNPLVRAAIVERVQDIARQMDVSVYRTIKELTGIAYSNIGNYLSIDPKTGAPRVDWSKCTNEMLAAVREIEIDENLKGGIKIKFKLHDKLAALTNLMKYQGLLNEENEDWKSRKEGGAVRTTAPRVRNDMNDQDAADLYSRQING